MSIKLKENFIDNEPLAGLCQICYKNKATKATVWERKTAKVHFKKTIYHCDRCKPMNAQSDHIAMNRQRKERELWKSKKYVVLNVE